MKSIFLTLYRWWPVADKSCQVSGTSADNNKDQGNSWYYSIFYEICTCKFINHNKKCRLLNSFTIEWNSCWASSRAWKFPATRSCDSSWWVRSVFCCSGTKIVHGMHWFGNCLVQFTGLSLHPKLKLPPKVARHHEVSSRKGGRNTLIYLCEIKVTGFHHPYWRNIIRVCCNEQKWKWIWLRWQWINLIDLTQMTINRFKL